jgi:hypothetical protein
MSKRLSCWGTGKGYQPGEGALITPTLFSQPSTRPCRGEEGVVSRKKREKKPSTQVSVFFLPSLAFLPSLPGRGGWRAGREGPGE